MTPYPVPRAVAGALAIIGAFLTVEASVLAMVWGGVLVPLAAATGILKTHVRFMLFAVFPIGVGLLLVWGVFIGAPPGAMQGSDPRGGVMYACTIAIRLAIVGGVFQLSFLSIHASELPAVLYRLGVRGELLVVVLGAFSVIPDMRRRADQVLRARAARGLMGRQGFAVRLMQLPYIVRPLFTSALRSAVQRADAWHQRQLLGKVDQLASASAQGCWKGSAMWLTIAAGWFGYAVFIRVVGM